MQIIIDIFSEKLQKEIRTRSPEEAKILFDHAVRAIEEIEGMRPPVFILPEPCKCGAGIVTGAKYCFSCGKKLHGH